MKLNRSDFPRKCQFPLLIALGTLPLMALIMLYNLPQATSALTVLIPAYVLLAWLCILLPGKIRLPAGLLSCALLAALSIRVFTIGGSLPVVHGSTMRLDYSVLSLLVPLLLCVFLLYGLQFASWPREKEIEFNGLAIGLLIHLVVQFVSFAERRRANVLWVEIQPLLVASFIAFLLLAMLSMKRLTMLGAAQGRQRVPMIIAQRNTLVTVSILAVALFVAAVPAISRALSALWALLLDAIKSFIALIASLLKNSGPSAPGMGGGNSDSPLMGLEAGEPSLLAILLEKIAFAAALLAACALLVLALRVILKRLIWLLHVILSRLGSYAASASQDYVDEITDTREDGGQTEGTLRQRLLRRMAFVNERRLSPTERIRYRYRRLLSQHPDWPISKTARENLAASDAALYEQARYSGKAASQEDAEHFLQNAK